MRKLAAVLLVAVLSFVANVASALRPVDFGDIYWVPTEDGWGMQVSDQGDVLFVTFYVYDVNHNPTWFTALLNYSTTNAAGARIYTGNLYTNTGPYFGGVFAAGPAHVATLAGTATFQADSSTTATLDYIVNGVAVHKSIQRYAYNLMNLSGTGYIGSFIELDTQCTNPAKDGPVALSGTFNITHNPPNTQVTVVPTFVSGALVLTCTYTGTFSQAGRYGSISNGAYTCTSGDTGTFTAHDIELTSQGILGRYDSISTTNGCHATGGFGGLLPG